MIRQHCSRQIWCVPECCLAMNNQLLWKNCSAVSSLTFLNSSLSSPLLCSLFQMKRLNKFLLWQKLCIVAKMIKSLMVRNKSGLASFTVSRVFHEIGQLHFCTLNNISHEYCPVAENISLAGFDLHMDSNTWKHQWSNSLQQCRASIIYRASFIHKWRR